MKQKTESSAMFFMLVSALLASAGQILLKFAANRTQDVHSFIFNPFIYLGGIAYLIGLLFMIKALRRGELSVVYPILATSFVWVSIFSPIFFAADSMNTEKWIGVAIIIFGVSLVGKGRQK